MDYQTLATDYDGTLAHHDVVDQPTLDALNRWKASGRQLILVTGRELEELRRVCPHLSVFDRIVVENGAVLHQPSTNETLLLGPPPPESFVSELRRRGVDRVSVGRVIVATWRPHETTAAEIITEQGLDLRVILNKGAVMILPPGLNKASGLARALDELDIPLQSVAAIGDAENDQEFLDCCGLGVAVANAVPSLKDRADFVTQGERGAGVIELIDRLLNDRRP